MENISSTEKGLQNIFIGWQLLISPMSFDVVDSIYLFMRIHTSIHDSLREEYVVCI